MNDDEETRNRSWINKWIKILSPQILQGVYKWILLCIFTVYKKCIELWFLKRFTDVVVKEKGSKKIEIVTYFSFECIIDLLSIIFNRGSM